MKQMHFIVSVLFSKFCICLQVEAADYTHQNSVSDLSNESHDIDSINDVPTVQQVNNFLVHVSNFISISTLEECFYVHLPFVVVNNMHTFYSPMLLLVIIYWVGLHDNIRQFTLHVLSLVVDLGI